jgi:SOS response regulatory protein OraA/RecX
MPVVTALRERPRGRVEVDLDGARWRVVPADAVVRSGLAVGCLLDRERARALARELRRAEALGAAVRALRHRDLSRGRLEERLADRGARPAARRDALETLERSGLVDDARVAAQRALALAGRGFGDSGVRVVLEQEGFAADSVDAALSGLEPEGERAPRLFAARGGGARALRWLTARGFDAATLDELHRFADEA